MKYKVGQKVVFGAQGVCLVKDIQNNFYRLTNDDNQMTFLVPLKQTDTLRSLSTPKEIEAAIAVMQITKVDSLTTWNRRYRENMELMATGQIKDVANVVGSLNKLKGMKDLSFGERVMLDRAKNLLNREIIEVMGADHAID